MDQSNNLENDLFEHYQFKADKGQEPLRVDKFLMNRIENSTRNKIQTAAKNGAIYSTWLLPPKPCGYQRQTP